MSHETRVMRILGIVLVASILWLPSSVLAHVTVKPAEVGVGKYQTFTVSVPNEKEVSTTGLRLILPRGLESVSPNVKPGWSIEIKRAGESMKGPVLNTGEKAPDPESVTELIWTGGSIPEGLRDEFYFSAKVPAEAADLKWMAYQTYANGEIVSWDQDPNAPKASGEHGTPFSITKVIDDLNVKPEVDASEVAGVERSNTFLVLSGLSVILSGLALGIALRKRS